MQPFFTWIEWEPRIRGGRRRESNASNEFEKAHKPLKWQLSPFMMKWIFVFNKKQNKKKRGKDNNSEVGTYYFTQHFKIFISVLRFFIRNESWLHFRKCSAHSHSTHCFAVALQSHWRRRTKHDSNEPKRKKLRDRIVNFPKWEKKTRKTAGTVQTKSYPFSKIVLMKKTVFFLTSFRFSIKTPRFVFCSSIV